MTFAERLRELRQLNNITQIEMANKLGLNRVTYTNYEREKSEPSISTLKEIATIFNVSIDYLIAFEDSNIKEKSRKRTQKLLLNFESRYNNINDNYKIEGDKLMRDLLNVVLANELSIPDLKDWIKTIEEKEIESENFFNISTFLYNLPKGYEQFYDLLDL
ncbi:helix-turn-helix domain-containing protein [Streptococcus uberis]|uniref:helix-turn-helix domain-containing protein n=1 Tax=Streptococcus uberis TaxID=1349 RepID=UPI001939854A|nr:helix-turn-helix transcriptional regulator [Streptococcus uberis]